MPIDLLIENATVVTMNPAGDVLPGGAVAVEGARIRGVYRRAGRLLATEYRHC